ncbi:hypothetical protein [Methylobacterium soli]|uniref:Uncharacterized protein n=1 Tax=Methylobacterium soli TaxID=553447 RepID=A0A6L3SSJ7_9HYPH|nr:hypothetical protein [Methylobacterium soli]KAB1076515.1 hypothetical protein F6X53_22685 [Methylobacterium soli]GJE44848.1 hypothetical protein AEGHOMDF_4039 [Methylobacterium soli]
MTSWLTQIADLFGASQYVPHSICLSSDPIIIAMYLLFNGSIALSYFTIAGILYLIYRNRAHVLRAVIIILRDPIFLKLFAIFIVACGATHVTEVLTLYFGVYRLDVFARTVTAGASVSTALRLILIVTSRTEADEILGEVGAGGVANYESRPLHLPNRKIGKARVRADAPSEPHGV